MRILSSAHPVSAAIAVTESSQVGEARRVASGLARNLGMSETTAGQIAIAASELASNLVKHAGGGQLILRCWDGSLEMVSLDKGPGLADPAVCLQDGYSTAGSQGIGLGAVARLSNLFEIQTDRDSGTALVARFGAQYTEPRLDFGAVSVPVTGEEVCGDHYGVLSTGDRTCVIVADGLGHGPDASEAAQAAIRIFDERSGLAPGAMVQFIHDALRPTRGAAVAVAEVDTSRNTVKYAGLGNIAGTIAGETVRQMVSNNGTAGHEARRIQEFAYPWQPNALLILHSDGLSSRWNLAAYPGLQGKHPALVSGVLYRDFRRQRDDATVVALRLN